jgi:hypothetical protein
MSAAKKEPNMQNGIEYNKIPNASTSNCYDQPANSPFYA